MHPTSIQDGYMEAQGIRLAPTAAMNRSFRKNTVLTGYQMMFEGDQGLDIRRNLREAIGEIVLCHRPRQLAAPVSEPKAEWGVVVSRTFNGTGVFEVHLLEGAVRTRVHRFKFVRAVLVPSHILELAVKLDAVHVVAPLPPVPLSQNPMFLSLWWMLNLLGWMMVPMTWE